MSGKSNLRIEFLKFSNKANENLNHEFIDCQDDIIYLVSENLNLPEMKNLLVFLLLIPFFSVHGQAYIKVIGSGVNIRFMPASAATIVAQSDRGRIFEVKFEQEGWYAILIASGVRRYIPISLCERTDYNISLPPLSQQKLLFSDLMKAEDRATAEADKRYSDNRPKNIDYQKLLSDKYKLQVFIKHNLQPPIYTKVIAKGVQEGW